MTKIEGKFYPLQPEEWLKAVRELKPAEKDLLYYLRTLDPFGDKQVELKVTELAEVLGRNKGTISRALKSLDSKGWIDLELVQVKVKVKSVVSTQQGCPDTTQVAATQPELCTDNSNGRETTQVAATQQSQAKAQVRQEVHTSKTNKTYIDFKDSLTQTEGERFEKFCNWKIKESGLKIISKKAWLNKYWEEYWEEFAEKYSSEKKISFPLRKGNNLKIEEILQAAKEAKLVKDYFHSQHEPGNYAVIPFEGKPENALKWIQGATDAS